jgi:hypothetical protein
MNPQIILRAALLISLLLAASAPAKTASKKQKTKSSAAPVTFVSACECHGNHGVDRWTPKTDTSILPIFQKITPVTPSEIYKWPGPGPNVPLTKKTETRLPSEQKWYALTGRIVDVRVEADGDIHVMLRDASGSKTGTVGAEIPLGSTWCNIRNTVFAWTSAKFPFTIQTNKVFKFQPHVITVTGKAFFDVDHAPASHSNRSTIHAKTAAWEIHPVRALRVIQ